jgi:hypothetical protein
MIRNRGHGVSLNEGVFVGATVANWCLRFSAAMAGGARMAYHVRLSRRGLVKRDRSV